MIAPIIYFGVVALAGCLSTQEIEDPLPADGTNNNPGDGEGIGSNEGEMGDARSSDGISVDAIPLDGNPFRDSSIQDGDIHDSYVHDSDVLRDARSILDRGEVGPDACIPRIFYRDSDGDGYGNSTTTFSDCTRPEGYAENNGDCDDTNDAIHPGTMEVLDETDNNCNGLTDLDVWRMVAVGGSHSTGLTLDGHIRNWGQNDQGQAPDEVLSEETFTQVCAGGFYSCGLLESGNIYCWGALTLPPDLAEETFNFVGCGWNTACGIRAADNSVICWGDDSGGQATLPAEIERETFSQVRPGWRHTCGLKTDGTVVCWGLDDSGRTNPPDSPFTQISAGWGHNCGIVSSDSTASCWGEDEGATLPLELLGETFSQVGAGWHYSCGLLITGAIECWGSDNDGQSTPPEDSFIQVSAGSGAHTCGVTTENVIRCWGDNNYGQAPDILSL